MLSSHVDPDELADAIEGLLSAERADRVSAHLADCGACRAALDDLTSVRRQLGSLPAVPMPPAVQLRLDAVFESEWRRLDVTRAPLPAAETGAHPHAPGTGDGTGTGTGDDTSDTSDAAAATPFEAHRHRRHGRRPAWHAPAAGAGRAPGTGPTPLAGRRLSSRWAGGLPSRLLAVAAFAAAVGVGGYWAGATAGLNEPPTTTVAVTTGDLPAAAAAVKRSDDVDVHRFSRAWSCAREVVGGRITGLTQADVDGVPSLLVYSREDGARTVSVVRGCDQRPSLVESVPLPR